MKEDEEIRGAMGAWPWLAESAPHEILNALITVPDVGVAIYNQQLRYEAINEALAIINCIPPEEHLGKTARDVMGDGAGEVEAALRHVFQTGKPLWNLQVSRMLPTGGEMRHRVGSYLPIKDKEGHVRQVGAVVVDITNKKKLEEAVRSLGMKLDEERRRTQTLLEVSQTLLSSLDLQNLFTAITHTVSRVVPHEFAGISIHNAARRGMELWVLASPEAHRFLNPGEMVPCEESMAWQAFHHKQAKTFGREDLARMNSDLARHVLQASIQTVHCVPLRTAKGVLGVLKVGSKRENAFSDADLQFFEQIAGQIAIALDNTRAYREIAELKNRLAEEKLYLEDEIRSELGFEEIIGESAALKRALGQAKVVASSDGVSSK